MRPLEAELRAGLAALALDVTDVQVGQLLDYLALIQKWTQVYNLTAVRDPAAMLSQHLLDSLAVVAPLRRHLAATGAGVVSGGKPRLLDVGSGAGLPGIVLAICDAGLVVDCVDTVAKKAAFIQQAAVALKLRNLHGIHARVESLAGPFDVVSCRAFASLADFTTWARAALGPGAVWLAMKGKHPADEIAALPAEVQVFHVEPLTVPNLDAERCIVWLRPQPTAFSGAVA